MPNEKFQFPADLFHFSFPAQAMCEEFLLNANMMMLASMIFIHSKCYYHQINLFSISHRFILFSINVSKIAQGHSEALYI
jgi:hypothetical protein